MDGTLLRRWFAGSLLIYVAGIGVALLGGWAPGAAATRGGDTLLLAAALGLLLAGIATSVVSWIGSLVRAGRARQWPWLAALLLAAPVALVLYVVLLPGRPVAPRGQAAEQSAIATPYGLDRW